jgi:hypothetical protein
VLFRSPGLPPGVGDPTQVGPGQASYTLTRETASIYGVENPVRQIGDIRTGIAVRAAGAIIAGDPEAVRYMGGGSVLFTFGGTTVALQEGSSIMTVNGTPVDMGVEVVRLEGRLFLPLRSLFYAFNWTVNYDGGVITVSR